MQSLVSGGAGGEILQSYILIIYVNVVSNTN